MAAIGQSSRTVYRAPTKGRDYLTARAAAKNEASAMLEKKYPHERPEYENGMCYYPGWHWSEDEQMQKVHTRLARLLLRSFRAEQRAKDKEA